MNENSQNQKLTVLTFASHLSFDMEYKLNQCVAKSMPLFLLPVSEAPLSLYESQCVWYNVFYVYVSLVSNLSCTSWEPVRAVRFCSATSVNRWTLHRLTNMFVCAEHPVAERCGNRVAVYFDFCFRVPSTFMVTFVCVPVQKDVHVHISTCLHK